MTSPDSPLKLNQCVFNMNNKSEQTDASIIPVKVYRCDQCGTEEVSTSMRRVALFQCSKCKEKFVAYSCVCPTCNLFARKIGKHGCLQCGRGELIKIEAGQTA